MSINAHGLEPIPEETRLLVQRLCPKGTMVTQLRDALGPIYSDEHFAHLYATRGRAAVAPWRLALVTALQEHVKNEIAPYKYPRAIAFIEQLPKTETGKLRRAALRQMAKGATSGMAAE